MHSKPIRVYADTSVFGGVFDEEFYRPSKRFFAEVRTGRFELVISAIVEDELILAPADVRTLYKELEPWIKTFEVSEEAVTLYEAYLKAGILTAKSAADALHVAMATVLDCRILVSWNCKHIVHFQKIPLYNAINTLHGYAPLAIHLPYEVLEDEKEDF